MNHTSISFPLGGCCKSLDNDNESSQSPRIYLKGKNINYLTRVLKKLRHVNTSILILKKSFFPIYSPEFMLKNLRLAIHFS